jgi:hypothetical protein
MTAEQTLLVAPWCRSPAAGTLPKRKPGVSGSLVRSASSDWLKAGGNRAYSTHEDDGGGVSRGTARPMYFATWRLSAGRSSNGGLPVTD